MIAPSVNRWADEYKESVLFFKVSSLEQIECTLALLSKLGYIKDSQGYSNTAQKRFFV